MTNNDKIQTATVNEEQIETILRGFSKRLFTTAKMCHAFAPPLPKGYVLKVLRKLDKQGNVGY